MVQKIDSLINEVYEASISIKDAEIRQQRIEMEKKEAMIIGLQGQINPHYLFNTLETIRMSLILKGEREIARIVKIFSKSFRYCIENKSDFFTLQQEIKFIEEYFIIQKYRYGDKVNLIVDVPESLLQYSIPKLTLQPLVENTNKLIIRVADDGVGIEEADLKKLRNLIFDDSVQTAKGTYNLSIALKNIHKRLVLLYGEEHGLKIESGKNIGTTVEVFIPICVKQ